MIVFRGRRLMENGARQFELFFFLSVLFDSNGYNNIIIHGRNYGAAVANPENCVGSQECHLVTPKIFIEFNENDDAGRFSK